MARIRSIHPGLYTDESFATLSMAARVLIIGIWNHADDGGGFEWKPLTLKMRIFPADNIDVSTLLSELEDNDIVKKYDVDGKSYGAVRNFGKWQKPKKPSRFCPMPERVREYACTNEAEKETSPEPDVDKTHDEDAKVQVELRTSSEPVPNQCGISISEGRKGGREEGRKVIPSLRSGPEAEARTIGEAENSLDARTQLFTDGTQRIRHMTGLPERNVRALIGHWLKLGADDAACVLDVIRQASDLRPAEPQAWCEAAVRHRGSGAKPKSRQQLAAETWANVPDIEGV